MTSWATAARLGIRGLLQNCRPYSRKVVRRPVRVLSEEEAAESIRFGRLRPAEDPVSPPASADLDKIEPVVLEGKPDRLPPGFPPYVKKGQDDTDLSRFALDAYSRKRRQKSGVIMLEGNRLIQEAFDAKLVPKALFFSQVDDVTSLRLPSRKFAFQKVTYEKIKRWSKLTTPPGVIGFFQAPDVSGIKPNSTHPFSIICDNIREPGNLGNILRTASSAGCKSVFLVKGCVDLWNEKVVRSGMGAHFNLCIKDNMKWSDIETYLEPDSFIMFADSKDELDSADIIRDDEFYESDMKDQNSELSDKQTVSPTENNAKSEQEPRTLPVFPYYLVDYTQMDSMYLVIGGETGFSSNAFNFGKSHKKLRVNIPLLNNVESLSVGTATAILAHEIKRQLEIRSVKSDPMEPVDSVPLPLV